MAKKQIILDDEAKQRIVEIEKLTKEERFCLDAYIISKETATDKLILAYSLSRKKAPTTNPASLEQLTYRWLNMKKVKYYIEDRQAELFTVGKIKQGEEGREGVVTRSKDQTIEELNDIANNTADMNKRADILMKIADLQQWKKKEETDEDSQIRYYMPLKCSKCQLFKSAKMAKSTNE